MATKYVKAYLLLEGGARLPCWFNPTTLTVSRRSVWEPAKSAAKLVPSRTYLGGKADELSVTLLLHAAYGKTGQDVQARIKALNALLEPEAQQGKRLDRPPLVQFVWGTYVSFVAVCESVKVTTELFDIDGTPLRAQVDVVLGQYSAEPGKGMSTPQNPTTRATRHQTAHAVQVGDSLASIAWEHYKDPTRWRDIARANRIGDPLKLEAGTTLVIPMERR